LTSGDLESRSKSTIYKFDLYLGIRYLHTKADVSPFIISGDIIWKPKRDVQTDGKGKINMFSPPLKRGDIDIIGYMTYTDLENRSGSPKIKS
jgi:hypothetical protein